MSVPSICLSVLTLDPSVLTIGLSVLTFSKSVLTPSCQILKYIFYISIDHSSKSLSSFPFLVDPLPSLSAYLVFPCINERNFQMSSWESSTFFLGLTVKQKGRMTASTPIETRKPLVKDEEASDVDVHLYRFQVTPMTFSSKCCQENFRIVTKLGAKSIDKEIHNMRSPTEKLKGMWIFTTSIDYHERVLSTFALTVSPMISTTYVLEQFCETSAKTPKTITMLGTLLAKVAWQVWSVF
ncbi:hypothetical protein Tco_0599211 [Tanacetum coccineum]